MGHNDMLACCTPRSIRGLLLHVDDWPMGAKQGASSVYKVSLTYVLYILSSAHHLKHLQSHQHNPFADIISINPDTMKATIAIATLMGVQSISALSVPTNVRNFYNRVKPSTCTGTEKLKGGFLDQDDGSARKFIRIAHRCVSDPFQNGPTAAKPSRIPANTPSTFMGRQTSSRTWTSTVMATCPTPSMAAAANRLTRRAKRAGRAKSRQRRVIASRI